MNSSQIIQWFDSTHLPPHLQEVVEPFSVLAHIIWANYDGDESTMAIRKLLEAKDCAVRAAIAKNKAKKMMGGSNG